MTAAAYTVAGGTQVNVAGVVYEAGAQVKLDEAAAAPLLMAGYLVQTPRAAKGSTGRSAGA